MDSFFDIYMQQYFDVESGSGTLTVFHTNDSVSFDVEHFGGFEIDDSKLQAFLTGYDNKLIVERDSNRLREESVQCGYLEKTSNGLVIYIDGRRETTVTLTPEQKGCLLDSITVGDVERYEDGRYPVEFTDRDGNRDRAEHERTND